MVKAAFRKSYLVHSNSRWHSKYLPYKNQTSKESKISYENESNRDKASEIYQTQVVHQKKMNRNLNWHQDNSSITHQVPKQRQFEISGRQKGSARENKCRF